MREGLGGPERGGTRAGRGRLATSRFGSLAPLLLWGTAGALVTLLALRFGMRAVGVRGDTPLPGLVYALTQPLVEPFYSFFPASSRFDYFEIEAASLAAAGSVLLVVLGLYVGWLLVLRREGMP